MAHHDDVAAEGVERAHRVQQGLALLDARPTGGDVRDVGGEGLRGELERHARARRRLGEEQDHGLATERRRFADGPLQDLDHRAGRLEHRLDLVARPIVGVEYMAA